MALARKCDRCGVFYDRYNEDKSCNVENTNAMAFIFHHEDNTYKICKRFDLCPNCKDGLVKWILKGE